MLKNLIALSKTYVLIAIFGVFVSFSPTYAATETSIGNNAKWISIFLFNNIFYILIIIAFSAFFSWVLHQLEIDQKRFFDVSSYKDFATNMINSLEKGRAFYFIIFIISFSFYVLLLVIKYFVTADSAGPLGIFGIIASPFNLVEVQKVFIKPGILQLIFFGYTYFIVLLMFLILLPRLVKFILRLFEKPGGTKIKSSHMRSVFLVLFLLGSFWIGMSVLGSSYLLYSIFLLAVIYVMFNMRIGFSAHERMLLVLTFTSLFLMGQLYSFVKIRVLEIKNSDSTFASTQVSLKLPLTIDNPSVSNTSYKVAPSNFVFISDYMIYGPKFSKIINMPISSLNPGTVNYVIVADGVLISEKISDTSGTIYSYGKNTSIPVTFDVANDRLSLDNTIKTLQKNNALQFPIQVWSNRPNVVLLETQ